MRGGASASRYLQKLIEAENAEPGLKPLIKPRVPYKVQTKILECLLCYRRYTAKDVYKGNYRLETMICSFCYREMQQQPCSVSCFGKPGYVKTPYHPTRQYGYSPKARECRQLCPDRAVCRLAVLGPEVK